MLMNYVLSQERMIDIRLLIAVRFVRVMVHVPSSTFDFPSRTLILGHGKFLQFFDSSFFQRWQQLSQICSKTHQANKP